MAMAMASTVLIVFFLGIRTKYQVSSQCCGGGPGKEHFDSITCDNATRANCAVGVMKVTDQDQLNSHQVSAPVLTRIEMAIMI